MKRSWGYGKSERSEKTAFAVHQLRHLTIFLLADWTDQEGPVHGYVASSIAFRYLYDEFITRMSLPTGKELQAYIDDAREQMAIEGARKGVEGLTCRLGVMVLDVSQCVASFDEVAFNLFRISGEILGDEDLEFDETFISSWKSAVGAEDLNAVFSSLDGVKELPIGKKMLSRVVYSMKEHDALVFCSKEAGRELWFHDWRLPHRSVRKWIADTMSNELVGIGVTYSMSPEFIPSTAPVDLGSVLSLLDGELEELRINRKEKMLLQDEVDAAWREQHVAEEEPEFLPVEEEEREVEEEEEEEEEEELTLYEKMMDALVNLDEYVRSPAFLRRLGAGGVLGLIFLGVVLSSGPGDEAAEDMGYRAEEVPLRQPSPEPAPEPAAVEPEPETEPTTSDKPSSGDEGEASADNADEGEEGEEGAAEEVVTAEPEETNSPLLWAGVLLLLAGGGVLWMKRQRAATAEAEREHKKLEIMRKIRFGGCERVHLGGDERHGVGLSHDSHNLVFADRLLPRVKKGKVVGSERIDVREVPVGAIAHMSLQVDREVTATKKGGVQAYLLQRALVVFHVVEQGVVRTETLNLLEEPMEMVGEEYEEVLAAIRYWEGFALAICPSTRSLQSSWEAPLEVDFGPFAV